MFDRLTFSNASGPGPLIDVGAVAEALLFYGRVNIVGNGATIRFLVEKIPPFVLLGLLKDQRITFHFLTDQIGVQTQPRGGLTPLHSLITFSSPQHTIDEEPYKLFMSATGDRLGARRFAKQMAALGHGAFNSEAILAALTDAANTERVISAVLEGLAPTYTQADSIRFRVYPERGGFIVDTNISFEAANTEYHRVVPSLHSSLSPAYLLALVQGAHEELYFSSLLNSEVAVGPVKQIVHSQLMTGILEKCSASGAQISAFSAMTLGSAHAVREAVNSGRVPLSDVVRLLDKAERFREWLHGQPPSAELLKSYYDAVVSDTWIERLPAKTTRWSIFTGGGMALDALGLGGLGTALGVAISAFDGFVLDKLVGGWKPHHFVERELKPMVQKE